MALRTADIQYFARAAVRVGATPGYAATDERKARLLAEANRNALLYYVQAQLDVRNSGYRVTKRVQDIIWATLTDIVASEHVPSK